MAPIEPTHPPAGRWSIATFGATTLRYVLLSIVPDQPDCCRLREGEVTAERPKILTPDFWENRFEGFGEEALAYRREMEKAYGEALKGLEYSFRNTLWNTSLEHSTLPDLLTGFTWRYYTPSAGSIWTAPNAIQHICQSTGPNGSCSGTDWSKNIDLKPADVLTDITRVRISCLTAFRTLKTLGIARLSA